MMTITTNKNGNEIDLEYGADLADTVAAIEEACAEDGTMQAEQALRIFPHTPGLHMSMREYTALMAAGCKECE